MTYLCPVCGYVLDEPPQNFVMCPSCGTEFGYDDVGLSYEKLRKEWISGGAQWWSSRRAAPVGWNPFLQLVLAGLESGIVRASANVVAHTVSFGEKFVYDPQNENIIRDARLTLAPA